MKKKLLTIAAAITALSFAAPAQALLVAGWDFSQYFGDGLLSTDGATYTDALGANYSSLDPSGLGPDSAAFGTLYLNGQFGSTNVGAGSGTEPVLPSAAVGGSLASNVDAPVTDGFLNPFDSFTSLQFEGQAFAESLVLAALGAASVVFEATPTLAATDWVLSFGGRTQFGSSTVGIEFSSDGVSYAPVGTADLTTVDTAFSVNLSAALAQAGFVRFVFADGGGPSIDNVAISASPIPEPGTALLLLSGLAGLVVHGRRRA